MKAGKKTLLIVGPKPPTLTGGIASFIGFQLSSPLLHEKYHLICLDTTLNPFLRYNRFTRLCGGFLLMVRLLAVLAIRLPALVHIHSSHFLSFWEKGVMLLACRLCRRRVLIHIHGSRYDKFYMASRLKPLIRFFLNRADSVIVLSSYWKNIFQQLTVVRLDIVPNCPREEFFNPAGGRGCAGAILFAGEVGRRKGADVLLDAIGLLRSRGVNNPVILAGGEEQEGDLESFRRIVGENGLGDVQFRGNVDLPGMVDLMADAAVFCLPSRAEGLPIAMLEAMAAGLPIVGTPVGGIPDAVEEGVNGFLVPVDDSRALANKLEYLLNNPELRDKIGRANFLKARQFYHPNVTAQALLDLYSSLIR